MSTKPAAGHKGAILAACMKRAKEIGLSRDIRETDILSTMSKNQGLTPYFGTTGAARSLIDRTEGDAQLAALVENYYRALKEDGGDTVASVVDRAAWLVGLRHNPLSMDEALHVRPINIVIAKPEAFEPDMAKSLFQVLASGGADLKLVERGGGQWRIEVIEKGTGGYGPVGMGRIRQAPLPALPNATEPQRRALP